jgi:hypothetical protein
MKIRYKCILRRPPPSSGHTAATSPNAVVRVNPGRSIRKRKNLADEGTPVGDPWPASRHLAERFS